MSDVSPAMLFLCEEPTERFQTSFCPVGLQANWGPVLPHRPLWLRSDRFLSTHKTSLTDQE